MQILINIPDKQIKKSLEESKYIHEDEGEKGFVNIAMLYTNSQLEFVDVERKTDFYSCKYKVLPKGHGDFIDRSEVIKSLFDYHNGKKTIGQCIDDVQTIIETDKESEG